MSQHHPGAQTPTQHPAELQPHNPTGTAGTLYEALRATAQHAAQARGYVSSVTHVTVHLPVDVVALALGRHRVTVWRAARRLEALGLIDARPHKTTALGGRTVNDGTLWAVRLNRDEGAPAKLTHEELTHPWRDLDRDRRRRRTAHRAVQERMQQSKELPGCGYDLELLLSWSSPPQPTKTPLCMTVAPRERPDLGAVLDVPYAAREDRNAMVDTAARALAKGLRDPGEVSLNFYRALLWALLRYADSGHTAPWYTVYEQAQRVIRADIEEGFARRPGAVFVSRLKGWPWWDELRRVPPVRVGTRPTVVSAEHSLGLSNFRL